jgi:chemosensory pili system protein ChpB (putative protein-glutamate methylesterase)
MAEPAGRAVGLALPPTYSLALSQALKAHGFDVEIAATPAMIRVLLREGHCQAWVFDQSAGESVDALTGSGAELMPVESLPDSRDAVAVERWCATVCARLATRVAATPISGIRAVWLLAGSAGAPPAVQAFLNAIPTPPPVAFLYAQHFDVDREGQLRGLVPENPAFTMTLLENHAPLEAGTVTIISPACQFSLVRDSILTRSGRSWDSRHAPDINQAIMELSRWGAAATGVILFSGMGTDGAAALADYTASGGVAWAQHPDDAICGAMPLAAVATGCISRTDTPAALASALCRRYSS